MSYVTTIVLVCEEYGEKLTEVETHLRAYKGYDWHHVDFKNVPGPKFIEAEVFVTAVNYCDHDELRAHLAAFPWTFPDLTSVVVNTNTEQQYVLNMASPTPTVEDQK